MKNNKIVLSNVIDGTAMVEWLKDSKEVNHNRNYRRIFGISIIHAMTMNVFCFLCIQNTKLMADDLKNNYKFIIGGLVIAIVFSLTYILLLRWFSWIMIWLSLLFIVGLLGFGELYCSKSINTVKLEESNNQKNCQNQSKHIFSTTTILSFTNRI